MVLSFCVQNDNFHKYFHWFFLFSVILLVSWYAASKWKYIAYSNVAAQK